MKPTVTLASRSEADRCPVISVVMLGRPHLAIVLRWPGVGTHNVVARFSSIRAASVAASRLEVSPTSVSAIVLVPVDPDMSTTVGVGVHLDEADEVANAAQTLRAGGAAAVTTFDGWMRLWWIDLVDHRTSNEPGERVTVVELLAGYAAAGYDTEMFVTSESRVQCAACGKASAPADTEMNSLRRMEGASDPDDLQVVVALACGNCGARGALVLGYGPNAASEDANVLSGLRDHRGQADIPGSQPPA